MKGHFPYPPDSAIGWRDSSPSKAQRLALLLGGILLLGTVLFWEVPANPVQLPPFVMPLVLAVALVLWHLPPGPARRTQAGPVQQKTAWCTAGGPAGAVQQGWPSPHGPLGVVSTTSVGMTGGAARSTRQWAWRTM